ncbi:MAG: hypothetical protein F6K45_23125 [Kamptonema sp. SIO1D9]|nr:hypothetical protein [Kamptonema sp. SIO1D9]
MSHLYLKIPDEVADTIIREGLSKAESKLFFYLLKLDRFGDRPVRLKVAEILLATGLSKSSYYAAIARFQELGWFDFNHSEVVIESKILNSQSEKLDNQSKILDSQSEKLDNQSRILDSQSEKLDNQSRILDSQSEKLETRGAKSLPGKDLKSPQTIQTYTNYTDSLSEEEGEFFRKFCDRKVAESPFKIVSPTKWLNKHYLEYHQEFRKLYPRFNEVEEKENLPAVVEPLFNNPGEFRQAAIAQLKKKFPDSWSEKAKKMGWLS